MQFVNNRIDGVWWRRGRRWNFSSRMKYISNEFSSIFSENKRIELNKKYIMHFNILFNAFLTSFSSPSAEKCCLLILVFFSRMLFSAMNSSKHPFIVLGAMESLYYTDIPCLLGSAGCNPVERQSEMIVSSIEIDLFSNKYYQNTHKCFIV